MDSITQVVLGGAVGEAVLGKEEGNRAPLWGMIVGTLPDLDVLTSAFVDDVTQLAIHRGLSHSIVFALAASPLLGWVIKRVVYPNSDSTWQQWSWLVFGALITHSLLDCFTNYGTQLFYPFTNYPVSFDAISIIDPLYTVPLALSLITAMTMKRNLARRRLAILIGLSISTAYLFFTLLTKLHVHSTFKDRLEDQGIVVEQLYTNPNLANNVLWHGVGDTGDTLWVGLYSIFDDAPYPPLRPIPKNSHLLEGGMDSRPVQRLLWFSKGYYAVSEQDGQVVFEDHRFPSSDFGLYGEGQPVFAFELEENAVAPDRFVGFRQQFQRASPDKTLLNAYWKRMLGHVPPSGN